MSPQLEPLQQPAVPRRSLLRRLWQTLPQSRRRQILFDVSRMIAPLTDADPQGGFPIGIAGLFSTASGIGEGARLAYTSLEAAGCSPSAFDLSPAFGQTEFTDKTERRELAPGSGTLIVHHNGPFMPHALWALGRARIRSRRIIGYWPGSCPACLTTGNRAFVTCMRSGYLRASPAIPLPPRLPNLCMSYRIHCRRCR